MNKKFFVLLVAAFSLVFQSCSSADIQSDQSRVIEGELGYRYDTVEKVAIRDLGDIVVLLNDEIETSNFELTTKYYDGRTITWLGDHTFGNNEAIINLVIPDEYEYVGHYAFYECPNLETVHIGANVNHIGELAFTGCPKLKEFTVSSENSHFYEKGGCVVSRNDHVLVATNGTIPCGVKKIGYNVFGGNQNIQKVDIPYGVEEIGVYSFSRSSAQTVTLSGDVKVVGACAFADCLQLEEIYIPKNVEFVGSAVFSGVNGITINCEAESKPETWDDEWLKGCTDYQVNWGVSA